MPRDGQTNGVGQLVVRTKQLTAVFMDISPEIAHSWLENNNNINRRMRPGLVAKYARDKANARWLTTHQGAAFDWNGELLDGQHSLASIIESGITTKMLIVRGLDPKVRMVADTGAPRKAADVLKLIGWKDAHNTDVAVVRMLMADGEPYTRRPTTQEIINAYETYRDAAKTAMGFFPKKKRHITIAPVYAPLARATYTENPDRLQEFADILFDGMAEKGRKGHASVILLRDHLLGARVVTGNTVVKDVYAIVEPVLKAFLEDVKLTKLEPTKEELFPIPAKPKARAARA